MQDTTPFRFIACVEGIDGTGKSTAVRNAHDLLSRKFIKPYKDLEHMPCVLVVQGFPSQEGSGRELRGHFELGTPLPPEEELGFVIKDMQETWERMSAAVGNRPAIFLFDRYYFSTFAYQSRDNRFTRDELEARIRAAGIPAPDLLCVLDLTVAESFARLGRREGEGKLTSMEKDDILSHCRTVFLDEADRMGDGALVFNAQHHPESVAAGIATAVSMRAGEKLFFHPGTEKTD